MITDTHLSKYLALALAVALVLVVPATIAADGGEPPHDSDEFPVYVMNKIDDQYRGGMSHGTMTMKVKTKHWTREMTLESWTLGKSYSLMRILKPKKEKGSATLKAKNDLFTYLSKTGRTIKITSGMMGGSWMGSHFTNDDLVRHTHPNNIVKDKSAPVVCRRVFSEHGGHPSFLFVTINHPT